MLIIPKWLYFIPIHYISNCKYAFISRWGPLYLLSKTNTILKSGSPKINKNYNFLKYVYPVNNFILFY